MFKIKRYKKLAFLIAVNIFLLFPCICHAQGFLERIWQKKSQIQEISAVKGFTYNLKRLLEIVREHVRRIDEEIKEGETIKRNEEREARIREHFEKGNQFYADGKLKEAKTEWLEVLEIAKEPEMKEYIKESPKKEKQQVFEARQEAVEETKRPEAQPSKKEASQILRESQREAEERLGFKKTQQEESCLETEKQLQVGLALCEQEKQLQQQEIERLEKERGQQEVAKKRAEKACPSQDEVLARGRLIESALNKEGRHEKKETLKQERARLKAEKEARKKEEKERIKEERRARKEKIRLQKKETRALQEIKKRRQIESLLDAQEYLFKEESLRKD